MWLARTLYEFNSTQETNLNFGFGELLLVTKGPDNGWLFGRKVDNNAEEGWFPSNYVEEVNQSQSTDSRTSSGNWESNIKTDDELYMKSEHTVSQSTPKHSRDVPPIVPPKRFNKIPAKVPLFTGTNESMKINNWIKLYEYNVEESERMSRLQSHLGGTQVLTWFSQEILPSFDTISWHDCKERMINRFGHNNFRPLIAAIDRKLEDIDTIDKYYTEKMALLNQTNMLVIDKVMLLTRGMPKELQASLTAEQISTPEVWLKIASLKIEEFKHKLPRNFGSMIWFEKNDTDYDEPK